VNGERRPPDARRSDPAWHQAACLCTECQRRRREQQFAEWARSDDPAKRFRAEHGGWDGFASTPTG
jgi:hypothetical protein